MGSSKLQSLLSEECIEVATFLRNNSSLQDDSLISHPSVVKFNGVTFKCNVFVLFTYDVFNPIFCKILDLLSTDDGAFLVCREFLTHSYDPHYHAYIIKPTCKPLCVFKISSLSFSLVFHPRRSFDRNDSHLYISLKTHIENSL